MSLPRPSHNVTWFDLMRTSWLLGLKRMVRLPFFFFDKIALTRLLIPMDISRFYEMPKVGTVIVRSEAKKIFDLSSPKLLAVELAKRGRHVVAVDVWDEEIIRWNLFLRKSAPSLLDQNALTLCVADGCALGFPDNSFDAAYSLSVIEHIPGDGDTRALLELKRIVKSGSDICLTVPYGNSARDTFRQDAVYGGMKKTDQGYFWQRIYDDRSIVERLIKPTGLTLAEQDMCSDRFPFLEEVIHGKLLPFSVLWGNLNPLFSALVHRRGAKPRSGETANVFLRLRK